MTKCVICDHRPARQGQPYCPTCADQIAAEERRRAPQPVKFLTYRGIVAGLYPNGNGELVARRVGRDPAKLPKGRTINLDRYCPGYTREQVKKFKRALLSMASVR